MCGIIGYSGTKNARDIIVTGLERLEYRGYDSAGLSIYNKDDNETLHLNPLLDEAENKHPRLREILILYMMEHDRLDKLIDKKIKFPSMYKLYDENRYDLLNESYKTNQESPFYKVFNSYKVKRDYRNKFKRN